MSALSKVRVAILSDQPLLRDSLCARLALEEDIDVVATLSEVPEESDREQLARCDVLVAHQSGLGEPARLGTTSHAEGGWGQPRVVLLLDEDDEQLVVEGLRSGSSGFVSTHNSIADLVSAILGVAEGETRIPPRLLPQVIEALQRGTREVDDATSRLTRLTERERQILELLADGHERTWIADELFISVNTVRTHISRLLAKLGVDSQLRAVSLLLTAQAGQGPGRPGPSASA